MKFRKLKSKHEFLHNRRIYHQSSNNDSLPLYQKKQIKSKYIREESKKRNPLTVGICSTKNLTLVKITSVCTWVVGNTRIDG